MFQKAEQQLGLHQNQTRHWPAWQHHVALTMLALHFMLAAQLEGHATIPNLSFTSLKLLLAEELRNLLQEDDALLAAIRKRATYTASKPTAKLASLEWFPSQCTRLVLAFTSPPADPSPKGRGGARLVISVH